MTFLLLSLAGLAFGVLGPLLATAVAVLAHDPARRADARQVLCLLLARPRPRRNRHEDSPEPPAPWTRDHPRTASAARKVTKTPRPDVVGTQACGVPSDPARQLCVQLVEPLVGDDAARMRPGPRRSVIFLFACRSAGQPVVQGRDGDAPREG